MKKILLRYNYLLTVALLVPAILNAQSAEDSKGLFTTDSVPEITLTGNMNALLNDRSEKPSYHPLSILYKAENGSGTTIRAEAKTRGHFRKLWGNCIYPPLAIHFIKNDTLKHSVFKHQKKLKLVMPCAGDEYVIREWLVYKIYNLVTPNSFKVRLVKVKLTDTKNKKSPVPFYGILLEEEKQMAERNGNIIVSRKLRPEQTEPLSFLTMAVFQYLAGNTDWSVQYLQNIKLIAADSMIAPVAVPYDFDHAGLVNAPYAEPAEALRMNSVRERRYRGYCIRDMKKFDTVIASFNSLKKDIYNTYINCTLLDEKYKNATLKYLDEFYEIINDATKKEKAFGYPCSKNGTGNVLIKGLNKD
jgi:hypothetical protein